MILVEAFEKSKLVRPYGHMEIWDASIIWCCRRVFIVACESYGRHKCRNVVAGLPGTDYCINLRVSSKSYHLASRRGGDIVSSRTFL